MARIHSAIKRRITWPSAMVVVCVLGLTLTLFASALSLRHNFAFRDTAHFYFPLYELVQWEWAAGRVPLWNPYEGCGVPLAADPTASVFYPGKLIFALPIAYAAAFKLYVVGHILFAAWTAYRFNRYLGVGVSVAGLGAIAYAFSGAVLSQYANVVYLVGAAWLPSAAQATDRTLRTGRFSAAITLGAVLALVVCGGDAQMAYHIVLMAALYAVLLPRGSSPAIEPDTAKAHTEISDDESLINMQPAVASKTHSYRWRLVLLLVAVSSAVGFSSVQLLPSIGWTRSTDRVTYSRPRSLFELPGYFHRPDTTEEDNDPRSWYGGILAQPAPMGTHEARMYRYSTGPWRLAEFLWPNFSGRQYPIHRRWVDALPAEGRVWVPSLYLGLVPFVLALSVWRLRGTQVQIKWLSWCVLIALLASLGQYGIGWLVHEVSAMWESPPKPDGASPLLGNAFGGVYWIFSTLLPGYAYFRYPGKWLVVVAWGISTLAALGWENMTPASTTAMRRWLKRLVVLSTLGVAVAITAQPAWNAWLAGQAPNALFGPLDVGGAWADLCGAFVHTAAVGACAWWLLKVRQGSRRFGTQHLAALALMLTVLDLAIAHRWIVQTAPDTAWQHGGRLMQSIDEQHRIMQPDQAPGEMYRMYRARPWLPLVWAESSSANRLAEAVRWEHASLGPKHNLLGRYPLITTHGSMMNRELKDFLTVADSGGKHRNRWPSDTSRQILRALNTRYLILPADETSHGGGADNLRDARIVELPGAFPRAWIVHDLDVVAASETVLSQRPADMRNAMVALAAKDLSEVAVVPFDPRSGVSTSATADDSSNTSEADGGKKHKPTKKPACHIVHYDPQRIEITATLTKPGLLILSDQYDPAWQAEVTTTGKASPRELPVLRANYIMRGVWLPAGNHRVVFRYRPLDFAAGASISAASWFTWLVCGCVLWRRQRKQHTEA